MLLVLFACSARVLGSCTIREFSVMPDGALKRSFVRALKYAQQPGQHTISAMRNVQCVTATFEDSSLTSIRHTHAVFGMH